MNPLLLSGALLLIAALINLPLGFLRQGYAKFSFGWFYYTHLSIPVIIYLRTKAGVGGEFLPLTLAGALAGQLLGGWVAGKRPAKS